MKESNRSLLESLDSGLKAELKGTKLSAEFTGEGIMDFSMSGTVFALSELTCQIVDSVQQGLDPQSAHVFLELVKDGINKVKVAE